MSALTSWASSILKACSFPIALAVTLVAQPASAAMISGTTGDIAIAPQPASTDYPEGSDIVVFAEVQDLAFPAGLELDLGTIPEGRNVDSYLFHFDPVGSSRGTATGSVTFSQPILGVIWTAAALDDSDSTFNAFLPTGSWRGLESRDLEAFATSLAIGEQTLSLDLRAGGAGIDEVRVLVATPEPTTTAGAIALGSIGLSMMAKRRRQQNDENAQNLED